MIPPTTPQKPWRNVSASQITTYRACPVKWWWEKIGGFTPPPTEAQLRGTRLHKAWEAYLVDGTVPEDPIAVCTLEHLPPPGSVSRELVEAPIRQEVGLPVPLIGYIDLIEPEIRRVTDHKTTSDFRYCRTPEELASDPQAIIYGFEALTGTMPGGEPIRFRHVYARTKGRPESTVREVVLEPAWIADQYERIVMGTTKEMSAHALADVRDVPHKTTACDRYGGCPHRARCLSIGKPLGGILQGLFTTGGTVDQNNTANALAALFAPTAPTVNPPDGTPADEIVTAEDQRREAPRKRADGPHLADGTRVRGLKGQEVQERYADEIKSLSPELNGIWLSRTAPALAAWAKNGFPSTGKLAPLRRDIVADAEMLEELRANPPAPAACAPAPAAPSAPFILVLGEPIKGADCAPGMYRSQKGYLVEILDVSPEGPRARYHDGEQLQEVTLAPAQPLRPTNETWDTPLPMIASEKELAVWQVVAIEEPKPDAPAPGFYSLPSGQIVKVTGETRDGRIVISYTDQDSGETQRTSIPADTKLRPWTPAPQAEAQPVEEPAPQAEAQPVEEPEPKPEPQPEPQPEPKPEPKPEPIPTVRDVPPGVLDALNRLGEREQEHATMQAARILYIGCAPLRTTATLAEDLLAPYMEQVATANAIPYYALLDYGKGTRQAVGLLLQDAAQGVFALPEQLVIDPRHPAGDALAEALAGHYDQIVKRIG